MNNWRIIGKEENRVSVGYGPISFFVEIKELENNKLLILKSNAFFIQQPDFDDLVKAVKSFYRLNKA